MNDWSKIDVNAVASLFMQTVQQFAANLLELENNVRQSGDEQKKDTESWGACPVCKHDDEVHYTNISRTHWQMCDRCQVCWRLGENLFSRWREETLIDWIRSMVLLEKYKPLGRARPERLEDFDIEIRRKSANPHSDASRNGTPPCASCASGCDDIPF